MFLPLKIVIIEFGTLKNISKLSLVDNKHFIFAYRNLRP